MRRHVELDLEFRLRDRPGRRPWVCRVAPTTRRRTPVNTPSLDHHAKLTAEDGARELCEALESGRVDKASETITLEWYKNLRKWHEIIREVEMYGGILDI